MKHHCVMCLGCAATFQMIIASASADTFGTGSNQFTIDFVRILGASNPESGYGIVQKDYRMGTYEITNDQWDKFRAEAGVTVIGSPSFAYDADPGWVGESIPTNNVSWYEAAQFVNWLNTSTGHHPAYDFTGTQGTDGYALATWSTTEAFGGTNLYRHKDAFYYLPTENEWVKAAYWNGTSLQTYATKSSESFHQGNGVNGSGWNYFDSGYATNPHGPWAVGSGSEELNGTYDMMGNVWEWTESPYSDPNYGTASHRGLRGGSYYNYSSHLTSPYRGYDYPHEEFDTSGFRVASQIPEPSSMIFFLLGVVGLAQTRRR